MTHAHRRSGLTPWLAAMALCGLVAPTLHAATLVVDTADDAGTPSTCTLRQAVAAVNAASTAGTGCVAHGGFGVDRIEFAAGVASVSVVAGTITILATDVTIDGRVGTNGRVVIAPADPQQAQLLLELGVLANPATEPARTLRLRNLELHRGSGNAGAGVRVNPNASLEVHDSLFEQNLGGAIVAFDARTILVERTTVQNGSAGLVAGGLHVQSSVLDTQVTVRDSHFFANAGFGSNGGGGIAMVERGALLVEGSSIANNLSDSHGGGIFSANGHVTLRNSTLFSNTAMLHGGGIYVRTLDAPLVLRNSTIAHNVADRGGGLVFGGRTPNAPAPVIDSTILAANAIGAGADPAVTDIAFLPVVLPADPSLTVAGSHNLVTHPGSIAGNRIVFANTPLTADPQLAPMGDNGGPTPTLALDVGSPAIDAGSNPGALAFDQRGIGFPRTAGAATDIGAYETAAAAIDGSCGVAHGLPTATAPTQGLCAAGTPGPVTGNGPWQWSCAGSDGGTDAACSAPLLTGVQLVAGNSAGFPAAGSVFGEAVTLRLDIESAAATGSAIFCAGSGAEAVTMTCGADAVLCDAVTVANGVATCSLPSGLPPGASALSAAYSGDGVHGAATSQIPFTVSPAQTQLTLLLSATDIEYTVTDEPPPVTASVQLDVLAPGAGSLDGTVLVVDGDRSCSIDLASTGTCALVVAKTAGTHTVSATFQPADTARFASSGDSAPLQVRRSTLTSIGPVASTTYGQPTFLSLQVGHGASPAVTGDVLVCDGGTPTQAPPDCGGGAVLCEAAALLPGGSATCSAATLEPGMHTLVAVYRGNATNATSMSAPVDLTVDKAMPMLSLTSDSEPGLAGDTRRYTVQLQGGSNGALAPSGTVDFFADDVLLCDDVALAPSGFDRIAHCDHADTPAGVLSIRAAYAGDARYAPGTAETVQTVLARSQLQLESSANPASPGLPITFTARLTAPGNAVLPTGDVRFLDGDTVLCADVTLDANLIAQCNADALSPGAHTIRAQYPGDTATTASDAVLEQIVEPATITLQPVQLDRSEGTGSNGLALDFLLSIGAAEAVVIDYAITPAPGSSGDLLDDLDGPASGSIVFAAGSTQATLIVPFVGDDVVEPDEAFVVTFSLNSDVAELSPALGQGLEIILRNDDSTRLFLDNPVAAENAPEGHIRFTWVLDAPVQGGVTVDYTTQDGTAHGGGDYIAQAGTLQHDGNPASTYHVDVPLIDDDAFESVELFAIGPGTARCAFDGCSVTTAPGVGTIVDDDAPAAGLAIFVSNGTNASDPGDLPTYRITVVNASAAPALQVPVHDTRPAALLDPLWTCAASLGGSCQPAAGSGDLATWVNLPPGAQAQIELDARVDAFDPLLEYRVDLAVPAGYDDADPDDNTATDSDVVRTIFTDDFDPSQTP